MGKIEIISEIHLWILIFYLKILIKMIRLPFIECTFSSWVSCSPLWEFPSKPFLWVTSGFYKKSKSDCSLLLLFQVMALVLSYTFIFIRPFIRVDCVPFKKQWAVYCWTVRISSLEVFGSACCSIRIVVHQVSRQAIPTQRRHGDLWPESSAAHPLELDWDK